MACVQKNDNDTLITIEDRFIVKNMLPVPVTVKGKEIGVGAELPLGYLTVQERERVQLKFDNTTLSLNISKQQKKVSYDKTLLVNS